MNSIPKQTATGGPHTQRYLSTNQHMSQTGGRPEYTPSPYVSGQGNQVANQGPGSLRAIQQQPVPPSSTPPNADLKVQQLPPQSNINPSQLMFQQTVRQPQHQFYQRSAAPSNQNPRMASHNNRPQQQSLFHQPQIFPVHQQQVFIPSYPYGTGTARQNFAVPVYPTQHYQFQQTPQSVPYFYPMVPRTGTIQTPQPVTQTPPQPTLPIPPIVQNNTQQHQPFPKNKRPRANAIPIIDPVSGQTVEISEETSQTPSGESSARQTPQPFANQPIINKEVQATFAKQVLQAIGSDDNQQRLHDDDEQHNLQQHHHSHQNHPQMPLPPTSSGSGITNSNLQHQPPSHPHLNQDVSDHHNFQAPPPQLQQPPPIFQPQSHIEHQPQVAQFPLTSPQIQINAQTASVTAPPPAIVTSTPAAVASSNVPNVDPSLDQVLNAEAKEFVLSSNSSISNINTAKETTPVVSANCDAEEVTLAPKLPKDRESPSKGRKYKEHLQQKIAATSSASSTPSSSPLEHHLHQQQVPSSTTLDNDDKITGDTKKHKDISSSANTTNLPQVVSKDVIPEEEPKKSQKKESKVEQKVEVFDNEQPIQQTPAAVQQETVTVSHAKPKQNARNASKQGGQQHHQQNSHQNNNNQKSNATIVPQSQPPKSSNKSHKKSDINQKGANKEGTDMDAFNDKGGRDSVSTTHASTNTNNSAAFNDIVNANPYVPSNVSTTGTVSNINNKGVAINSVNNNEINNKQIIDSNNETSSQNDNGNLTIKSSTAAPARPSPITSTKPKSNRVDVTSIVREQPKVTSKPLVVPQSVVTNNSTDETDRAVNPGIDALNVNNKLVSKVSEQTATQKTISEISNRLESTLPYQEGQWTPTNPNGSKTYNKDFLMALRNCPNSKIKPEKILDSVALDDRVRLGDGRGSMGGRTDFNPSYNNYGGGGKSGSQRGTLPKRNSSQSKQGMGSGNKNIKPTQAKVSISLREDVKLHEAENAWRPARFAVGENATDDDRKTELLYKKVRGILNKLTPQKFDTLLGKIKDLDIDNQDRLQGVIDLVFDKAVDEPNFSVAYAKMCKELALMQVKTANSTADKVEIVNFRKILITRCQVEFEKQSVDESTRNTKLKEIEECSDPDKKKDLQFDLEEYDRKLRMKSVGNVRFIGELFKQDMLTVNIMVRCLHNLLDNKDEESLECLCKLLTTIGKELENKNVDVSPIFNTMKALADKKDGKISSRIRFMLQDVIELRVAKWVPRRQDLNPKTIDQIQKEAETEQLNIQMMNSVPLTPRRDDRMGGGGGSMSLDRKAGRGRNVTEDGWTLSNQRNRNNPFVVQTDKFKNKAPLPEEPLGSMSSFQTWSKGSTGLRPSSQITNTSNIYSALDNSNLMDSDKRGSNRPKDSYHSKGPSLDRNYNKYDGRGSRSGSQHRSSNDSSNSSSQRSTPAPMFSSSMGGPPPSRPSPANMGPPPSAAPINTSSVAVPPSINAPTPTIPAMSDEQMERSINNSIDEYVSGNAKVDEYFQAIASCIPQTEYSKVVMISYLRVFEKSQNDRLKTGELFGKLVKQGLIHRDDYCAGLEEILAQAEDLKIDIPKFWDYLAEILVDIVNEEALPLNRLLTISKKLISPNDISKLIACIFKLIVSKKGSGTLHQLWQKSGVRLTDFLESSQVQTWIVENQLNFLVEGGAPANKQEQLSFEKIQEDLSALLRKKASHDEIFNWITENVGELVKENKFIRALATAIFEDSISPNFKLQKHVLTNHSNLLLKYIDNKSNYELEGLYALQALIHKLEHPQGLLLEICTTLLDSLMFSQESFVAWEESNDPAEQEGKGVALKQLTAFICQLKENDDDDEDTSGEDA